MSCMNWNEDDRTTEWGGSVLDEICRPRVAGVLSKSSEGESPVRVSMNTTHASKPYMRNCMLMSTSMMNGS